MSTNNPNNTSPQHSELFTFLVTVLLVAGGIILLILRIVPANDPMITGLFYIVASFWFLHSAFRWQAAPPNVIIPTQQAGGSAFTYQSTPGEGVTDETVQTPAVSSVPHQPPVQVRTRRASLVNQQTPPASAKRDPLKPPESPPLPPSA